MDMEYLYRVDEIEVRIGEIFKVVFRTGVIVYCKQKQPIVHMKFPTMDPKKEFRLFSAEELIGEQVT
jgi:hypothetical protein